MTTCRNGHPRTPKNTYVWRGQEYCRVCRRDSKRRAVERGGWNPAPHRRKTHCKRGHPLVEGNVYLTRNQGRRCRTCELDKNRRQRARRSSGRPVGGPRKTHCKRGHQLTPGNVYVHHKTGARRCSPCKRESDRRRYEEVRAGRQPRELSRFCRRGHPRNEQTTYVRPNGARECRVCKRQKLREDKRRPRVASEVFPPPPEERTVSGYVELWTCTRLPGRPKIQEAACDSNRELSRNPTSKRLSPRSLTQAQARAAGHDLRLQARLCGVEPCLTCPGVRGLVEDREAPPPNIIEVKRTARPKGGPRKRRGLTLIQDPKVRAERYFVRVRHEG